MNVLPIGLHTCLRGSFHAEYKRAVINIQEMFRLCLPGDRDAE